MCLAKLRMPKHLVELVRTTCIAAWLVGAGAVIALNRQQSSTWVELLADSLIIPILLASFSYGRSVGLLVALIATLINGSVAISQPELQSPIVQRLLFQIVVFNLVVLVTSGLSERQKQAVRSSHSLFQGVPVGLYRTALDGRFLDTNPALIAMLGFPDREMLLAADLTSLYVDSTVSRRMHGMLEQQGEIHDFDLQLRRHDGAVIWVRNSARIIRDSEGQGWCYEGTLVDITKRRQAEEALRASEHRLRLIAENANDLIMAYDMNRRLIYVNPAVEELTGYTVEELQARHFINWVHPEDEAHMLRLLEELFTGKSYSGAMFRRITKAGQVKWTLGSWGPLYDEHGRQVGVQGNERDITEQKRAEEALKQLNEELEQRVIERTAQLETANAQLERELAERRRAEAELRRTAEATQMASEILRHLNAAPNITEAFPAIAADLKAITGCTRVSLSLLDADREWLTVSALDQPRTELSLGHRLHLPDCAGAADMLAGHPHITPDLSMELDFPVERELYQAGYRSRLNLPLRHGDAVIGVYTFMWSQVDGYDLAHLPLLSQIGEAVSLAITRSRAFDETQQRAREAETLRQAGAVVAATLRQEEAIKLILEQLARVVPHDSATVQLLRDGCLEIVGGYSWQNPEAKIGMLFPVPGDNPNTIVIEQRQPVRIGNANFQGVHRYIKSWLGVPLIVGDRVIGMLAIDSVQENFFTPNHTRLASAFADQVAIALENARLFAEAHERAAALEDSNKELESFSYSVSHDLRAPLRHLTSFATLLHDQSGAALDDTGRRYLTIITDAATRMGKLIDALLAFSRLSRTELRHVPVDLTQLIREAQQELLPAIASAEIDWQIAPLPEVHGDPDLLRQVFINLLSNALKYSRSRTPARIEIGTTSGPADEIVCFVRDNGVGFEMQYVDKLFGVFQRLHSAKEFEGTGIGLANIQRIIQRHGGRVWAEGVVDGGATFYFALPRS